MAIGFAGFVELIRLPLRIACVLFVVAGAMLFLPEPVLLRLALAGITSDLRVAIGMGFLVAVGIILVNIGEGLVAHVRAGRRKSSQRAAILPRIDNADESERSVLRKLVGGDTSTVALPPNHGAVKNLEESGIIERIGGYSLSKGTSPFRLTPDVAAILQAGGKHADELRGSLSLVRGSDSDDRDPA